MLDQQKLEITAAEFERLQQGIFIRYAARSHALTAEEKVYLQKIHDALYKITEHIKEKRDKIKEEIRTLHAGKKMRNYYAL